jgi:hypothetical protein
LSLLRCSSCCSSIRRFESSLGYLNKFKFE